MTGFVLGFGAALVAIQFYPRLANVGKWIVTKAKDALLGDDE